MSYSGIDSSNLWEQHVLDRSELERNTATAWTLEMSKPTGDGLGLTSRVRQAIGAALIALGQRLSEHTPSRALSHA